MPTLSQRVADGLIAWRWALLLIALVAAVVTGLPAKRLGLEQWIGPERAAWFPAGRLELDRSIEGMFRDDGHLLAKPLTWLRKTLVADPVDERPLLQPYLELKETFGGNEVALAVYVDDDLLAPDGSGLRRLAAVAERFEQVPGVMGVLTLERVLGERATNPRGAVASRLRHVFEGYTHGADNKTAGVVCMLEPAEQATVPRKQTIGQLRELVRDLGHGLPPGMLTGEPVMLADGFRLVEHDGQRLWVGTTALLMLTIVLCFRSLRWMLIPIAVVQLTLLLTEATLVWSQMRLSMVSTMLGAIVTVIGIATVMHVIVRFREGRLQGLSSEQALARAGALLAAPIFLACTTDAVGFAVLMWTDVGPVQDFGLMLAIGSLLVLVSVTLLVPGLVLWGRLDPDPQRAWGESKLDAQLHCTTGWVDRYPWLLGGLTLLLAGLAVTGIFRLQVETDFTKNFRADTQIVRAYQFVENRLGGAGVWDIVLPAPEQLDWDYLRQVRSLQQRLRQETVIPRELGQQEPGLTKVISIVDAMEAGVPVKLDQVRLAFVREGMVQTALQVMRQRTPVFAAALHAEDPQQPGHYRYRIMLRAKERQSAEQKLWLIDRVRQIVDEELSKPEWRQYVQSPATDQPATDQPAEAQVTGFFVLLTNLVKSLVRDQWACFGLASVGIALMMLLAFRSPVLALVALVPNVLPILLVLGLLGWLELKINMGAAMIAAVSMGLSVDSSIHYITAFRRARTTGQTARQAIAEVQQTVGRALVFSTLALIIGFSILATSPFVPTIYFGVLVSLAMLGGLFGNLLVLPLLLQAIYGRRELKAKR